MKKLFNKLLTSIKYSSLELFSSILLSLWAIAPIIEYIFKNFFHRHYTSYYVFSIRFIGILGILEFIIYICKKIKDKSLSIRSCTPYFLILILLIIAIISSIYSDNPHLSFFGESYRKEGLIVYIMYIGFILSASIIKKKEYIQIICKIIIFSALFITIAPNYNPNFSYINYINVFHNTNHYGYFLMISTILSGFMFVKNTGIKKIIYLLIYIFLIYMLIYNDTFGCYLSLLIVLIFSLIYSIVKKYKIVNIIILIVTFLLTSFIVSFTNIEIGGKVILQDTQKMVYNNFSVFSHDIKTIVNEESDLDTIGTGRGLLWKTAWNYTLEHPLIGGGMECLNEYFKTHNAGYNDRPHNIILQFTSFIGIPGAIIYIILIGYLAIINLKNLNKDTTYFMVYVSAMCYFISSNFGNSMYYTSPYFMILLGFLISMQFTNSKET